MKSIKSILVISLTLLAASPTATRACIDPVYAPAYYYMYRVTETQPGAILAGGTADDAPYNETPGARESCLGWQRLTSDSIPLGDIYEIVYKMPLDEYRQYCTGTPYDGGNRFMRWIKERDREILDFLSLAKTNEHLRLTHISAWYYPTMETGADMTLDEVADEALAHRDSRLRDRYLLQAVRALTSLKEYDRCIAIWEDEASRLPEDNVMRRMIYPYIAGAYFNTGDKDRAMRIFADLGDINSLLLCMGKSGQKLTTTEAIEMVYRHCPGSPYFYTVLQRFVRDAEPYGGWDKTPHLDDEHLKLKELSLRIAREMKTPDPALWLYTAAFIADMQGNADEASAILALAERAKGTAIVKESVKVMRIWLDAKRLPYDSRYEKRLLKQLAWLDRQIAGHLTPGLEDMTIGLRYGYSFYYWNDMMRRIIFGEVCPRMLSAGRPIRALQLANMADNRLMQLLAVKPVWEGGYDWHSYINHFFDIADTIAIDDLTAYIATTRTPRDDFDRFTNERGRTGDYLAEIAGTRCLRLMKYAEAAEWLATVSYEYNKTLNVELDYDPFELGMTRAGSRADFRLQFARRMHRLEQTMQHDPDPGRRAMAMVSFATGLRNSFGRCWALTQYHYGLFNLEPGRQKRDWTRSPEALAAAGRTVRLIDEACRTSGDDEWAAGVMAHFGNYRTAAETWPATRTAARIRHSCDVLRDYHCERSWTDPQAIDM